MSLNPTSIDWPGLTHTWNPVVGCIRKCGYCYAEKLHNKRHKAFKRGKLQNVKQYAKPFEEIQFIKNRLIDPYETRKPYKIFVGSMSDIYFWDKEWMERVLKSCRENPQHTFMFLTKSPFVYRRYNFPDNCMLGLTITAQYSYMKDEGNIAKLIDSDNINNKKFLSIEPLLGVICEIPESISLVIVGQMTGKNAIKPQQDWIDSIKVNNATTEIHWKGSLK